MKRDRAATRRMTLLVALCCANATSGNAQTPASTYTDLQSALEKAQASAHRPGDESLTCEALQSDLVTAARHPAVQSFVAKAGADAEQRMAAMKDATSRVAAQMALTVFSSIVPGGAWAGQSIGAAQAQAQQAQAASNIQHAMQQAQELIGIMPQLLRGQRVIELAQARDCAWLREASSR